MNNYLIYCKEGTGGLFLSAVLANQLGIKIKPNFSKTGNSHDLGRGNWKDINSAINLIGNHWHQTFKPNNSIYYVHQGPIRDLKNKLPNLKVILIDFNQEDYYNVTRLFVCKAFPNFWTLDEYNKWVGPSWPAYNNNNINDSAVIRDELINSLIVETENWINTYDQDVVDFRISFKTIMGLDKSNLAQEVSDITKTEITNDTKNLILEYQTLNKKLYFNA